MKKTSPRYLAKGAVALYSVFACAAYAFGPDESIANQYSHRVWRIDDGLPQNRIWAISQTTDGYLWIATSEGLARFDGIRFTVFDRQNTAQLRDSSILTLCLGRDGSLWIGTEGGGLVRYKDRTFERFSSDDGLTNDFVRSIYEDRNNILIVGTDRGFFRMAGRRFIRIEGAPEVPSRVTTDRSPFHAIGEDEAGRTWVISPVGLLTISGGKLVRAPGHCSGPPVGTLLKSRDGSLWGINAEGAGRMLNGCLVSERGMPRVATRTLINDSQGNLWIGT